MKPLLLPSNGFPTGGHGEIRPDKPDLRISLLVQDATEALADCGFEPFAGKTVKAVVAPDFKH